MYSRRVKKNGFAPVIILIVILLIAGVGYFFFKNSLKISITPNSTPTASSNTVSATPGQSPLFSGKLTKLNQDLGLIKATADMPSQSFVYYSAGQFTRGSLVGYTRIITTMPQYTPSTPPVYTLATKDFKTFVLDDPDNATTKYPETDYNNPYSNLDKSKITSTAVFDTDQPISIPLDDKFSLYRDSFLTNVNSSSLKDSNGNPISYTLIQTDFSSLQKLSSPASNLTMYFQPESKPVNKYVTGDTTVVVVDSTGLPAIYSITTSKAISDYKAKVASAGANEYVYPPSLGFKGSDISNSIGLTFYKDYESAFPGPCSESLDGRIVNLTDSDFAQIGTVNSLPVFSLKDVNSELYTIEYNSKMGTYNDKNSGYNFNDMNHGVTQPANQNDYVKNNPLLFIKDNWGRWVALGEWDIQLPGGCGKPVIYLYPQKDTKVTLKFDVPVSFTTDIPSYGGYWQVLAHRGGLLTNLRPELTNCAGVDSSKIGSEYVLEACQTNNYPYLYWSGNVTSIDYPKIDQGWIVGKDDLKDVVDSKLKFMGLNDKEKNDFESYWIPEMLAKNTEFYRVSFLTTEQVNKLFPMTVTPTPDTTFRIFMDWQPLSQKPTNSLQPQVLPKLIRNGFTMVEWGGLKTP